MYDLAIIGGGPAGVSGGVYASRKKLKTVFITERRFFLSSRIPGTSDLISFADHFVHAKSLAVYGKRFIFICRLY